MSSILIDPLRFWGKASPGGDEAERFHPLVFHALDVSAVFEALIEADAALLGILASSFSAPGDRIVAPLAALVALHDIGKVSKKFQAKSEEAWPAMLGVRSNDFLIPYDHAAAGYTLLLHPKLNPILAKLLGEAESEEKQALISPIVFHHGKPQDRHPNGTSSPGWGDEENACIVADAILSAFDLAKIPPLQPISEKSAQCLSWRLSGLVSLADWIGSSTEFFPYRDPADFSPRDYWLSVAQPTARKALLTLRLTPCAPNPGRTFATLFEGEEWTRSPSKAQSLCGELDLPEGPMLVFIEDVTGAGKTESALLLAQRMMFAGKGSGLFVALPTMATANAMYERMKKHYRRLFVEGADPSLALAHGRSKLHEGFRASILPKKGAAEGAACGEIETVQAGCSAFFADDRRKALLADVGVGTIDQALLGVLPTKYATLRLLGLAGKILIVDEAHAYDAYMSREVERLLTFHAGMGGSSIILSATLPRRMKEQYARAFRGGRHGDGVALSRVDYPLVTAIPFQGAVNETPLETRADLNRSVAVTPLPDCEEALNRVTEAAENGAAVAYIRNSVDDAIEAFETLRARGLEPTLFHARFATTDRLAIEKTALEVFGKKGAPEQRKGRVLVATQVVEQSLDLDFDLMASDLAPVDLLIQRAGRLWRHQRGPRPISGPDFLVVSPEPVGDAGADWYKKMFPRAAYVYEAHALLWLGAKVLFETGAIVSPQGVRPLVETVYGAEARERVPVGLRKNFDDSEGAAFGDISHAENNLLDFFEGYAPGHQGWSSDIRKSTRLGEERTVFRLAFWDGGRLRPYASDPDLIRAWALSEVSVSARRATARGAYAPEIEATANALESKWRETGDGAVVLPLMGAGPWRASGAKGVEDTVQAIDFIYDAICGLRLPPKT
jgi:CRISPR-associated endonuclease/helicase Cas3